MILTLLALTLASFTIALVGAVIPGPVFAVTVAESMRRGSIAGPLIAIGHFLVEVVIIVAAFFGLESLLKLEATRIGLGYFGGVALILMGIYFIKNVGKNGENLKNGKNRNTFLHTPVFSGALASCSNPYFFLWWVTPGLPLMFKSLEVAGLTGFIFFYIGHSLADLSWFSFVSYSTHKSKKVLNKKAVGRIIFGGAIFLIVLGIYFIYSVLIL